ncbi:glycosyltransferase family 4 protein [Chitinophaga sp. GCM10012297]|uniref:Glycosyltransferase family 4 protein n=1 Tax=Chitinophaga chungangae TaxID=2821488 RepID=A0ABS3YHR7_9BACT|nr:glycosyltransferase family 4 protein [Chitinophaga chungangae]MBO9154235.1 glycosyltransferase family 4 protein [Chitinophaga chungangae]
MAASRKIRILQAIRQGQIGGGESHVLSLVAALDKERFEPVVLSFTDGPMIDRLQQMKIPSHVISSAKPFDPACVSKVSALLKKEEIDLVHAHGTRAASNLFLPAKLNSLPMIYTIHGWSFHQDQPFFKKHLRILSERMLTGLAKKNISVSASNRETGTRHFSGFRSEVINNGIDLDHFNPARQIKDLREELNIPADHTVIGYIARITLQKDPLTLIRAFSLALQQNSNLTLLVVGDGDLKKEMVELAEQLGISANVRFQPFRTDVPEVLNAIDVFCLPSLWEGMPIGLLEAMAMAKAVIVTAVDGSREIVQHNQNGLIVPVKDPEALAAAMTLLHHDASLRGRLQVAASATVSREYCMKKMARKVEGIYSGIIQTPQRINIHEPNHI